MLSFKGGYIRQEEEKGIPSRENSTWKTAHAKTKRQEKLGMFGELYIDKHGWSSEYIKSNNTYDCPFTKP